MHKCLYCPGLWVGSVNTYTDVIYHYCSLSHTAHSYWHKHPTHQLSSAPVKQTSCLIYSKSSLLASFVCYNQPSSHYSWWSHPNHHLHRRILTLTRYWATSRPLIQRKWWLVINQSHPHTLHSLHHLYCHHHNHLLQDTIHLRQVPHPLTRLTPSHPHAPLRGLLQELKQQSKTVVMVIT